MKIWFISDTHTHHAELDVPDVDMVIHCGDEANQRKSWLNKLEALSFFEWFDGLEIETKIFIPGNHSTAIEDKLLKPSDYPNIRFLIHEAVECHGLKIFGTPYTPFFFNWAYMKPRSELDAIWATIPAGVDILISHGPPKGIFDVTRDWRSKEPIHVGSKSLARHVNERIKPRFHIFGHLHDEQGIQNFGMKDDGTTLFINCACCDLSGQLVHHGQVFDLK